MTHTHRDANSVIDISIGEAKMRFSELASRALAGERFRVRRRDKVVAAIVGPDDLVKLERQRANAVRQAQALGQHGELCAAIEGGEVHPSMAAFGLLADDEQWDEILDGLYRDRSRRSTRDDVQL
jgi:antitoxin (DNA-binding transcriptional repressor) of toxin-antitoxin stability system